MAGRNEQRDIAVSLGKACFAELIADLGRSGVTEAMQPIGRDRSAVGLHLVLVGEPRGAECARLGPEASKVLSNAWTQCTEAPTHRCAAGDRSCVDVELVRHDCEQPDAEQLVGEAVLLRRPGSQAELRSVLELDLGVGSVAGDGDAGGGNGEKVPAAVVRGVQYRCLSRSPPGLSPAQKSIPLPPRLRRGRSASEAGCGGRTGWAPGRWSPRTGWPGPTRGTPGRSGCPTGSRSQLRRSVAQGCRVGRSRHVISPLPHRVGARSR